ncbi:MAG: M23 family metallopeptidase [Sphingomonadales bacterium]|nr:M23 family metallopeptidase [Sphingomonadales bacterium]
MKQFAALGLMLSVLGAAPLRAEEPATSDAKTETVHVVKSGETLGGIANRAEVPRVLIIEANALKAPYALRAGQKLVIPRRRSHTVKDGETGFSIAMDYGVPWSAIAAANGLKVDDPVKSGQKLAIPTVAAKAVAQPATPAPSPGAAVPALADTPAPKFAWPLTGKVRRPFLLAGAKDGPHEGIDLLSPEGTAVRASAAGKVIFAGQGPEDYGLTVIVFHGGRWTTTYSFLSKVTVKEGDEVKAGERVGLVGETGMATEPQLHFEVRRNRVALDPVKYLPKAKK